MKQLFQPFTLVLLMLLNSCINEHQTQPGKSEAKRSSTLKELQKFGHPVISEILQNLPESIQQFSIDNSKDTILLGEEGSVISLNSSSFVDKDGYNPKRVKIELIEAISLADMIKYGLSTISDDNILESDGMVFLNAYDSLNNQLLLKDGATILIEIPAIKAVPNIQLFTGSYDANNTLNWSNPKPSEKYLRKVSLNSLNFFHTDSNLLASNGPEGSVYYSCGLDSSLINPLYNSAFQNTIIATREFEQRMHYINLSCDEDLLMTYINNTDKNLWEIDSLAYIHLRRSKSKVDSVFQVFASQKKTTIKDSTQLIKNQTIAISQKLNLIKRRYKLQNVLYNSFATSTLGWINADRFIFDQNAIPTQMDVFVSNIEPNQKCFTSLILSSYKSVLTLSQDESGLFRIGKNGQMKLPPNQKGMIVSISTNDSLPLVGFKEVLVGSHNVETITLREVSFEEYQRFLLDKISVRKKRAFEKRYQYSCCESADSISYELLAL